MTVPPTGPCRHCRPGCSATSPGTSPSTAAPAPAWRTTIVEYFHIHAPDEVPVAEVTVKVEVVEGRPRFKTIELTASGTLAPQDVQRLPWARWAKGALERVRDPLGVNVARTTARRAATGAGRRSITPERLREVLDLKAEAQAAGAPRWDVYVGKKLSLNEDYVRQLGARAERELG